MNLRWRASLTLLEQQPATPLSATLLAKKKGVVTSTQILLHFNKKTCSSEATTLWQSILLKELPQSM
jgi:hypothetical protein